MEKLVFVCSLFIALITLSQGQTLPCPSIGDYDIKNLTQPAYWQFDLDPNYCVESTEKPCHFFFTFCKYLPKTNSTCVESSVCQSSSDSTAPVEIGHYTENPFSLKEDNGFYAKFNGTRISHKGKQCNASITLEFDCNKNEPWLPNDGAASTPKPTDVKFNPTTCEYYIKFDYAGACHRIVPPSTTPLNPTPAKICIPPAGYDITPLTLAPYWIFNINDGCLIESNYTESCTLFMSFCKPIESLVDCKDSSGCIRYPNLPDTTIIVANYSEDPFTAFEKNGFLAEYPAGEDIINRFTGKHCNIEIEIKFDCDKDAIWEIPPENQPGIGPEPIAFTSITNSSCQVKMTIPYSGACSKKKKDDDNGMSAGGVLTIIFILFFALYFGVGFMYQTFIKNETGLNRIPHFTFWSSILLFALEGFIYTWRFVTCQSHKESLLKYESI